MFDFLFFRCMYNDVEIKDSHIKSLYNDTIMLSFLPGGNLAIMIFIILVYVLQFFREI